MLVFLCGLVGSGKTTLAQKAAARFDIPLCSLDDEKRVYYPKDPDFERNMREGIPFCFETRMQTYRASMERIAALAASYPHVVVEEALHTKAYREAFRTFAREHGWSSAFIWVDMEDAKSEAMLQAGRSGHMLSTNAIAMRRAMNMERDGEEDMDAVIANNGTIDSAWKALESFLLPLLS